MLFDHLLKLVIELSTTALVVAALVLTCASLIPPRRPGGPRP
ncbi:hypothetical protein SUDANB95_02726 [Actinosynnema sp. ALI-1.44]